MTEPVNRLARTKKISGVVVLDKPVHESSNQCLRRVQRLFGAAKAGHTGSLDPMASGVLPLCFGEATKLARFLLEGNKAYRASVRIGVCTSTDDREGEVIATRSTEGITSSRVQEALNQLQGCILQTPPVYSAVKYRGQPLYKLARRGICVQPAPRKVKIFKNRLLAFEDSRIDLEIVCSKGTYIRTLAKNLGEILGCGAHLCALRRTHSGPYSESDSVDMASLEKAARTALCRHLKPIRSMIPDWPALSLTETQTQALARGQAVTLDQGEADGRVRLVRQVQGDELFLGIGQVARNQLKPIRLVETSDLLKQA